MITKSEAKVLRSLITNRADADDLVFRACVGNSNKSPSEAHKEWLKAYNELNCYITNITEKEN